VVVLQVLLALLLLLDARWTRTRGRVLKDNLEKKKKKKKKDEMCICYSMIMCSGLGCKQTNSSRSIITPVACLKAQSLLKDVIISGISTQSANCSRGIAVLGG
jgi:hypothetical protein